MSVLLGSSGASVILGSSGGGVCLVPDPGTTPLERGEHPRFLLTTTELDDIRTVAGADSLFVTQMNAFVTYINSELSARTTAYMSSSWEVSMQYLRMLGAAYHFAGGDYWDGTALASGAAVPGITGLQAPSVYAARIVDIWDVVTTTPRVIPTSTGDGGVSALSYDWTFPCLDSGRRTAVAAWLVTDALPLDSSNFDFWSDTGDTLFRIRHLATSMALQNDGLQTSFATTYDKFSSWWRGADGWATGHSAFGGTGSGWVQGMFYGNAYHASAYGLDVNPGGTRIFEEMARTALGQTYAEWYAHDDGRMWRYFPRYALRNLTGGVYPAGTITSVYAVPRTNGYQYLWRPGELSTWHATSSTDTIGKPAQNPGGVSTIHTLRVAATITKNWSANDAALAKWLIDNVSGPWAYNDWPKDVVSLISGRGSNTVTAATTPSDAGESLSMFGQEGHWTFRTDWATRNAPVVMVLSQKWPGGSYGFRHVGEILLFRNGPVLNRRTNWSGHTNVLGAANASSMSFPTMSATRTQLTGSASGEVMASAATTHIYLGGERLNTAAQLQASDMVDGGAYDCLKNLRQWLHDGTAGRDVDYLFLDLYTAYDDYTTKLNSYVRQVVYFRPSTVSGVPRLVVFDRPSVKSPYNWGAGTGDYAKMQGWTTAGEPTFADGTSAAGPSRGPSGTAGKTYSTDATYVTCDNTEVGSDSTLHLTVLRPTANRRLVKLGGPSTSALYQDYAGAATEWSHERDLPQGYPLATGDTTPSVITPSYAGAWHLYIEDSTTDAQTIFVTALEATDQGDAKSTTEAVTGSGLTGARIGDRIAVFGETSDAVTSGTFTIPSVGTYKVLIAGVAASAVRTLSGSGATVTGSLTASAAGTLYLDITTTGASTVMTLG